MLAVDPRLIEAVAAAEHICCLTGAGVSAESGVPTFRGAGGLWRGYDATALATPEAFAADPDLVWTFYHDRRTRLLDCQPNAGHAALVHLATKTADWTLVTQNVDGLHTLAGSRDVIELHGNIWVDRCSGCAVETYRPHEPPAPDPHCELCGAHCRPGVVWFGEALPPGAFEAAVDAAVRAEVFLVVGTSGVVQPAAGLASIAADSGARVVEINPETTAISGVATDILTAPAALALPKLLGDMPSSGSTAPTEFR